MNRRAFLVTLSALVTSLGFRRPAEAKTWQPMEGRTCGCATRPYRDGVERKLCDAHMRKLAELMRERDWNLSRIEELKATSYGPPITRLVE